MFSKAPSKRPAAAGSGPSRAATGFGDTAGSRPNSAPLQVGFGIPQVGGSPLLQPSNNSTHPSSNNNNNNSANTDGLSLVEQRLRIVKRNRSRSTDEGESGSVGASPVPSSLSSPSFALPPSVAPLVSNFPAQDLTAIPKHDKAQLEAMVSDVVLALFFSDGATSS